MRPGRARDGCLRPAQRPLVIDIAGTEISPFAGLMAMIGVLCILIAAVVGGKWFAHSSWASSLTFSRHQTTILMAIHGFVPSVLPVWLLLTPRNYLST